MRFPRATRPLAADVGYPSHRLQGMFERALEDDQAILLIDGLDEVTSNRNEVIDALTGLVDSYITPPHAGKSQAVITSRIDGYSDIYLTSGEAAHYLIRAMSGEQVSGFVTRFFSAIEAPGQAALFLERLEGSGNAAARRLAGTPLSLTSMCSYWHRHSELPPNEAMLYRRLIVDTSFWWRGFAAQDGNSLLDRLIGNEDTFLAMLSRVAVSIHEDHVDGQLTEEELLEILDSALYGAARLTGADTRSVGRDLVARIREKVGVLAEFSPGKFRFLHQVYREYLVGYDLLNRPVQPNRGEKPPDEAVFLRLKDRIGYPRWREPVLLALGECGAATRTTLMQIAMSSAGLDLEEWIDIFLTAAIERPSSEANSQELTKLIEFAALTLTAVSDYSDVIAELDVRMAELRTHFGEETFDFLAMSLFAENDAAAPPLAALYWRRCWLTASVLSAFAAATDRDSAGWGWPIQRALRRAGAPPPLRTVTIRPSLDRPPPDDSELSQLAQRLFQLGYRPWEQQRRRVSQEVVAAPAAGIFPVRQLFLDHPDQWQACLSSPDSLRVLCALFGGLDHHDALRWAAEDEDFARLLTMPPIPRSDEIVRRAAELVPRFGASDVVVAMALMLDRESSLVSAQEPAPAIDLAWMTCPSTPSLRSAVSRWLHRGPGDPDLLREELARLAGPEVRPADRAEAELGLLVLDGRPMTPDTTSIRALGRALEATRDGMLRSHRAWFAAVWSPDAPVTSAERAAMHRFLLRTAFAVAGRPMPLAPEPRSLDGDPSATHPVLLADDLARQVLARSWGSSRPGDIGLSQLSPDQVLAILAWLTTLPYADLGPRAGEYTTALWDEASGQPMIAVGLMPALRPLLSWAHRQDPQLEAQISAAVQAALVSPQGLQATREAEAPRRERRAAEPPERLTVDPRHLDLSLLDRIRGIAEGPPGPRGDVAYLLVALSLRAPEEQQPDWQATALDLLGQEADQERRAETLSRIRGYLCADPGVRERLDRLLDGIDSPVLRADAAGDLGLAAESLIQLVGAEASQAARVSLLTTARLLAELARVRPLALDHASDEQAIPGAGLSGVLGRAPAHSQPWFLLLDQPLLATMTTMLAEDPAADETLAQLLPLISRIDDEAMPGLNALLDSATPGARWVSAARNLLALRRAAEPGGYPGIFRDLVEMIQTGDATTSARSYLQLLGPYSHKDRSDRRYLLSEHGFERWWELGADAVAETDPVRRRFFWRALSEWDIDDEVALGQAAERAGRGQGHQAVWLKLLDTAAIWREGPQLFLARWLDAQPPETGLATACLNLTAMLATGGIDLPVTAELTAAAVRACMRAGLVPRTVPGLARHAWRTGIAQAVAEACVDALGAHDEAGPALDAAMANLRDSSTPVITVDSAGATRVDLAGYGDLQWVPTGARPEEVARFASAELSGERAITLLAGWAGEFERQGTDSLSPLDYAAYEAVLSLLVVLSAREGPQFRLCCPPESIQRVFSRAALRGGLVAMAGLTLLSRLRFVDLAPSEGPDLIEVLHASLRAGPNEYSAALEFLENVRHVRGASLVRAICEQIEHSPNESAAQGFALLAAVYLSSPTCSTADVRRLRDALRSDVGEKAQRCAVHLSGDGGRRKPIVAVTGPSRESEFRRLRHLASSPPQPGSAQSAVMTRQPASDGASVAVRDTDQLDSVVGAEVSGYAKSDNQEGWLARIAEERISSRVSLIKSTSDNRPAWYYVKVDLLKIAAFHEAVTSGPTNLKAYGEILYSGWGHEPPVEIARIIQEEYWSR